MKKLVSLLSVLALLVSMVPATLAEEAAAPEATYVASPNAAFQYVEPVYYENGEGEPTIGVTYVGVLEVDGKYFKDSNNNQQLDVFEDWRLDVATRAADLVSKMSTEQRIGLLINQLAASPSVTKGADAYNEDGTVNFSKLLGLTGANSVAVLLNSENRSGVVRSTTDVESGALWNNAINSITELDTLLKGTPAIPYFTISNPQGIVDSPATEGRAAAVMGDVANGGDYDLIYRFAELDRKLWNARGIDGMYGIQIDLITDPRWPRNNETYTEVPEVNAGITTALVTGYKDGQGAGSVSMTLKHFPGDGAALNGFESHNKYGEWRVYLTEGSLEKYHLVGFQAGIDAGATGIMPGYSRPSAALNATQSYRGVEIPVLEIANAYSTVMLEDLLRGTMGFTGYVNTDSNILSSMNYGAEEMTMPERYAAVINAGSDVIGDGFGVVNYDALWEAYNTGLIEPAAFDRATTNRVSIMLAQGEFENPYRDPVSGKALQEELNASEIADLGYELHHKSVVLMKNHENALPLTDTSKKVYIESYTQRGENEDTIASFAAAFEAAGFTVVSKAADADVAFIDVVPGGVSQGIAHMGVIDLVDGLEVAEYKTNETITAAKTGNTIEVTTLMDVNKIAKTAETVHANGGIVVASINITNPWILTNLEPHVDALIGSFSTSVAARVDVMTGAYNPTGRLPVTMVSCNEVIATVETEIDGETYDICVSPNDVPGYDKDQYIAADVLAQSPSGSYAYRDADGNVYAAWYGLSY